MLRLAGAFLVLIVGGCAPAAASPPKWAAPDAAPKAARAPSAPVTEITSAIVIEGETIRLNGAPIERDELTGALERSRGEAELLSVELSTPFSERALAALIAAAPQAGFKTLRLLSGSDELTFAIADPGAKERLIAWTRGDQLLVYDLEEPGPEKGLLGSFQIAEEHSATELGRQLGMICQGQPCRAQLELTPTDPAGGLWRALSILAASRERAAHSLVPGVGLGSSFPQGSSGGRRSPSAGRDSAHRAQELREASQLAAEYSASHRHVHQQAETDERRHDAAAAVGK